MHFGVVGYAQFLYIQLKFASFCTCKCGSWRFVAVFVVNAFFDGLSNFL